MNLLLLLFTAQFCTAPFHPQFRTIPVVSDERGNLFFGDPFEQNEATEVQTPNDELQLTGEVSLSVNLSRELHVELPQAIRTLLNDEDAKLQSADMYQPVHTEVQPNIADPKAHQRKISSPFSQGPILRHTDAESIATDPGTLLACGDLGSESTDSINVESLLTDTEMKILLSDTCPVRNAGTDEPPQGFSGSGCGQPVRSVRINFNQSLVQSGFFNDHFVNKTGQKTFKCGICQKQYRSAVGYRLHQRKHSGEKPFQCGICLKQFSTSSNYQTHRRIHTSDKPFQCDACSKRFLTSSSYQIHRRIHTAEKPFKCNFCKKEFSDPSNYLKHRRIHTGEKPFECDICSKWFRTPSDRKKHQRIHTGEKPFHCNICLKQFRSSSNYQAHQRTHINEKPYQCDLCAERFLTSSNYQKHRKTHTGEKQFKCDCQKEFSDNSSYSTHNNMSYICYWCNQDYCSKHNLIEHVRKCSSRNVSNTADPVVSCFISSDTRIWTYMQ